MRERVRRQRECEEDREETAAHLCTCQDGYLKYLKTFQIQAKPPDTTENVA